MISKFTCSISMCIVHCSCGGRFLKDFVHIRWNSSIPGGWMTQRHSVMARAKKTKNDQKAITIYILYYTCIAQYNFTAWFDAISLKSLHAVQLNLALWLLIHFRFSLSTVSFVSKRDTLHNIYSFLCNSNSSALARSLVQSDLWRLYIFECSAY